MIMGTRIVLGENRLAAIPISNDATKHIKYRQILKISRVGLIKFFRIFQLVAFLNCTTHRGIWQHP